MISAEVTDAGVDRAPAGRLAELYLRHAPEAVRLAYVLTGDRTLAEDLVQEAFARLAGRFAHLRDPAAFDAYLRRTVVNLVYSHFRRRRVERAYLEREGSLARPGDPPADPETRDEMWTALQRLPVRQRAAIALRFYEDLPDDRIADVLGCRPATVRSLVHRGLQTLRVEVTDA
ncbi:MAG: SigE family RNA polymerase sigma factor [Actinomycetota bacterium]